MLLNYTKIDNEGFVAFDEVFEAHVYKRYDGNFGGVILYGINLEKTYQRFNNEQSMKKAWEKVYSALRQANYNRRFYLF